MSLDGDLTSSQSDDGVVSDRASATNAYENTSGSEHESENIVPLPIYLRHRLMLNPNLYHEPDNYEDLKLDHSPSLYSALERYLPTYILRRQREEKVNYMREVLQRYCSPRQGIDLGKLRMYRLTILANYQVLHSELYNMNALEFFVPSFLDAILENTEQAFRSIMSEPSPGIFTFEMLQPRFCEMFLEEVEHFQKWAQMIKFKIMRPSSMNKYGAVLDDFGFQKMLQELMEDFISPISEVFFPEVGGSSLDTHHGVVVEYGIDRDVDIGLHVDDSDVTLNVCLGKEFSGGEIFFRGVRCEKHVNTEPRSEEVYNYSHVQGCAVLHRGRHRHGAMATTSGNRINLVLWCKSSIFREQNEFRKDFFSWCTECQHESKERRQRSLEARVAKLEQLS